MHLNMGNGLKRPYESGYSIFRRFLVSNPTLSVSFLAEYMKKSHLNYRTFSQKIIKKNLVSNKQLHREHNLINSLDWGATRYHCPICAQQCYHTDLFSLSWINECPIHHKRLVKKCPICKQSWPSYEDLINRGCSACGRYIDYSKIPKLTSYDDISLYIPISKLFEFIFEKKEENVSLESSLSYYSSRRGWINDNDPLFPSYERYRHHSFTKNILKQYGIDTTKLLSKQFRIYEIDELNYSFEGKDPLKLKNSWISEERHKALSLIVKCIKSATTKTHQLEVYDFAVLNQKSLKYLMPLCPYCVAFSLWYYRITGITNRYRVNARNPLASFIELTANTEPYRPIPVDTLMSESKSFNTSLNFKKWLYQRDMQATFINLFNYSMIVLKYFILNKEINYNTLHIKQEILYLDQTLYYAHDTEKMQMHAYYRNNLLLNETTLPKITGATAHCKRFKNFIENDYRRDGLKHFFTEPPCSNGLNYAEYVILEHGRCKYYTEKDHTSRFLPKISDHTIFYNLYCHNT